jgi:pimeloyl-ACP methyl ester carboxylesterase
MAGRWTRNGRESLADPQTSSWRDVSLASNEGRGEREKRVASGEAEALYDKVAPDPKKWLALVRAVRKMLLEFKGFSSAQVGSIKAEVLITQGDHDGYRPERAVEMFRLIPHAQLAIFPNADHFMIFMQPEKLQSTILAFLDPK